MPALNTKLKLPTAALLYSALGALGVAIIITVGGVLLMFAAEASCSGPGCGILSSEVVLPFLLIIVLVVLAYPLLFWLLFSYELTGRTITVNSGILFRQYETMDFGRIQVVDNERGPLLWLLALTEVRIWTASADQLTFSVGKDAMRAHPHPDATLLLRQDDAQALKDFIMQSKPNSPNL